MADWNGSELIQIVLLFITARKRSLRQGNIFTPLCHSVHSGVPGPGGSGPRGRGVPASGGCLVQGDACSQGVPGQDPPLRTATAAGGTQPTGIHSCYIEQWRTPTTTPRHLRTKFFSISCSFFRKLLQNNMLPPPFPRAERLAAPSILYGQSVIHSCQVCLKISFSIAACQKERAKSCTKQQLRLKRSRCMKECFGLFHTRNNNVWTVLTTCAYYPPIWGCWSNLMIEPNDYFCPCLFFHVSITTSHDSHRGVPMWPISVLPLVSHRSLSPTPRTCSNSFTMKPRHLLPSGRLAFDTNVFLSSNYLTTLDWAEKYLLIMVWYGVPQYLPLSIPRGNITGTLCSALFPNRHISQRPQHYVQISLIRIKPR